MKLAILAVGYLPKSLPVAIEASRTLLPIQCLTNGHFCSSANVLPTSPMTKLKVVALWKINSLVLSPHYSVIDRRALPLSLFQWQRRGERSRLFDRSYPVLLIRMSLLGPFEPTGWRALLVLSRDDGKKWESSSVHCLDLQSVFVLHSEWRSCCSDQRCESVKGWVNGIDRSARRRE